MSKLLIPESELTDLDKLAIKYGVGKGPYWISYTNTYDKYFKNIRSSTKKVLEIGVEYGNSARMWKEYFHNANIYGIDINENSKLAEEDRISIFIANQSDKEAIDNIISKIGIDFDIIIDDASHKIDDIINSFNMFFSCVRPGGMYIIEDIQVDYNTYKHREFINFLIDSVNLSNLYYGSDYYSIRFTGARNAVVEAIKNHELSEEDVKYINDNILDIDSVSCHRGFYIINKRK
jgi:hypothetical protein